MQIIKSSEDESVDKVMCFFKEKVVVVVSWLEI